MKKKVTKHILAEDQHLHEMILNVYHLLEHKVQAESRVTQWPSTDAHQRHTPTALSKAYLEEPVHMPF